MIKINLYGGPSSGKSTLAAQIYADFKLKNLKVELVQEYAKELVYQNHDMRRLTEAERIIILGEQFRRERILKDNLCLKIVEI
jgi:adenylate kinase family enzyme